MATIAKPLLLDETYKEGNAALINILENITTATDKATEAAASADVATAKADIATEQASITTSKANEANIAAQNANNSANEAKAFRDSAAAIVTPDGLATKVADNTDTINNSKGLVKVRINDFKVMNLAGEQLTREFNTEVTTRSLNVRAFFNLPIAKKQNLYFKIKYTINSLPSGVSVEGIFNRTTKISNAPHFDARPDGYYYWTTAIVEYDSSGDIYTAQVAFPFSTDTVCQVNSFEIYTDAISEQRLTYLEVGADRDYHTFKEAFDYAEKSNGMFGVKFFGNGTPHIINNEYGNTDVNGLSIPFNVREIIGVNDRDMNIVEDTYNNGAGAAFWIEYGCKIRNIKFIGTGKYCIHIDKDNNNDIPTIIENCSFTHRTGGSGAIGIGFHARADITIRNNIFLEDTDAGIRVHNWDYANQVNPVLKIYGNRFVGYMIHAIHLYTVNRYNYGFATAEIIGNDFNGHDILLSEEAYPDFGVGNHWRVVGNNNSAVNVTITHHDDKDYSNCIDLFLPNASVVDTKIN